MFLGPLANAKAKFLFPSTSGSISTISNTGELLIGDQHNGNHLHRTSIFYQQINIDFHHGNEALAFSFLSSNAFTKQENILNDFSHYC